MQRYHNKLLQLSIKMSTLVLCVINTTGLKWTSAPSLYTTGLVVLNEDSCWSPCLGGGEEDHHEDGEEHEEQLEDVRPDHRLHPSYRGVEDADQEYAGTARGKVKKLQI